MKRVRRAPAMIGAAILLPLLIFLGVQLALSARAERGAVEAESLARTQRILIEADGQLQRTLGALEAVASAASVEAGDWAAVFERLDQVRRRNPQWVTALVTDLRAGRQLLDLRDPYPSPPRPATIALPRVIPPDGSPFVGGMGGAGRGCPCALVHLPVVRGGRPAFLVTVALDPEPFRRLILADADQGRIVGIFDREGRFVARSIAHAERVGRPATRFVREAIARAPSGIYRGRTFEGFVNYSAYSTSPLSGWSAHVAFSPSLLDSPRRRSLVAAGVAALASLLLAVGLVAFTLRQLAAGRRVEARLQEAQKMEALGQITGGIAHDFNNLLTPIIGGLEVIARGAQLEGVSQRLLDSALSSARRAAKLTSQLLAFSRRQKLQIAAVDLPRLLADIRPMLVQSVGPSIRIEIEAAADVSCVRSDANQLELALLNLALNARDAMPDGGTLSISARLESGRKAEGETVVIQVSDTGQGMPADVVRRAAEPFFTTKGAGSGTGLGLPQVYGVVHQSGGSLAIDSEPGRGTVVTLRLPACPSPAAPAPSLPDVEESEGGAGRRIVLCDDDDLVRGFVARVLDAIGYVVETVSDGRAAVELARNPAIDLLIVDFAMPAMNGAEVVRAVRAFRPDLPILMITGYADTNAVAELGADVRLLRKPFETGVLLAAVREAVGTQGG